MSKNVWVNIKDLTLLIDDNDNSERVAAFKIEADSNTAGSGTELFRVVENGNVGIGTTNPVSKLDVNGSVRARQGIKTRRTYRVFYLGCGENKESTKSLGAWDFCQMMGFEVKGVDNGSKDYTYCRISIGTYDDGWGTEGHVQS